MTTEVLIPLVRVNLAAAVAILLVFALRHPTRRLFGARLAYALWTIVPLAAAAVVLPRPAAPSAITPLVLAASEMGDAARPVLQAGTANLFAMTIWIAGALAAAALMALRQARYLTALGPLEPVGDGTYRAQRAGGGPAIVGALRPRIVTPPDFEVRFTPAEREVILAHERAHLATGDTLINAAVAAIQCLAWFNPLVHLGARALRVDQELACDAAVLARFPRTRRLYAELLLKTQLAAQPLPFGCHWPAASDHPLKERIVMLKSPLLAPSRRMAGAAAVTALALGAAAAAWAAQPVTEPHLIASPDWSLRPTGEDVLRVYPARTDGPQSGRALLTCRVDNAGLLTACAVKSDDPAFGQAALQLAASFQMRPLSKDGAPTAGGQVRIPILFQPPAE